MVMNLQFQYALSTVVTAVAVLSLGLFVLFKNPRARPNQLWALFNAAVFVWAACQSIHIVIHDFSMAYFLIRLYYMFGVLWIPTLYLHFILVYLNERRRWPLYLAYGFSFAYLTQVFNPKFLAAPQPKFSLNFYPEPGPLFYPFLVLWSTIVMYSMMKIYNAMQKASGIQRNQLRYLFYAMLIGYVGGTSNFLPVFDVELFPYTPYGTYGVPIYVAIFTYAIVKHQLMDIKVAITRTGVLLATYLVVLGVPFAVGWWGRAWLSTQLGANWWLVPLGLCTVLATIVVCP